MLSAVCWGMLAIIHAIPAFALFRPVLISKLYGISPDSSAFLLLHHRAALFLAIFIICLWSIFRHETRQLAAVSLGVSMVSFLWLYWSSESPVVFRSIAIADLIGLPFLIYASVQAFRQ